MVRKKSPALSEAETLEVPVLVEKKPKPEPWPEPARGHDIVVIGASAGGVRSTRARRGIPPGPSRLGLRRAAHLARQAEFHARDPVVQRAASFQARQERGSDRAGADLRGAPRHAHARRARAAQRRARPEGEPAPAGKRRRPASRTRGRPRSALPLATGRSPPLPGRGEGLRIGNGARSGREPTTRAGGASEARETGCSPGRS